MEYCNEWIEEWRQKMMLDECGANCVGGYFPDSDPYHKRFEKWSVKHFKECSICIQPERSKREDSQYELECGCRYVPGCEFGHCITCTDPIHKDFNL